MARFSRDRTSRDFTDRAPAPSRGRTLASGALALGVVAAAAGATAQTVSHPAGGLTLVRGADSALAIADLCATGVSVRATAYGERDELASSWASRVGASVAINADLFTYGSYAPDGRARGNGMEWPAAEQFTQSRLSPPEYRQYWQFGRHLAQLITNSALAPAAAARDIVGGHNLIIQAGRSSGTGGKPLLTNAYRHTAIGISADHRTLFLLAVDTPVTGPELAARMLSYAAIAHAPAVELATNEDGGGSTQMYVAGLGLIIPSSRGVANHLGIVAGGSGLPTNCEPPYAATFVAQSYPGAPAGPPVRLTVGESMDGWFELRNTGTATWTPSVTKFAPTPRDAASPLASTSWLGAARAATVTANVAPGATYRFPVRITGNRVGDFTQTFGMLQEGVVWFSTAPLGGGPADTLIRIHVIVTAPTVPMDAGVHADVVTGHDVPGDHAVADVSRPDDAADEPTEGFDVEQVPDEGAPGDARRGTDASADADEGGLEPRDVAGCACRAGVTGGAPSPGRSLLALLVPGLVGLYRPRRRRRNRLDSVTRN